MMETKSVETCADFPVTDLVDTNQRRVGILPKRNMKEQKVARAPTLI